MGIFTRKVVPNVAFEKKTDAELIKLITQSNNLPELLGKVDHDVRSIYDRVEELKTKKTRTTNRLSHNPDLSDEEKRRCMADITELDQLLATLERDGSEMIEKERHLLERFLYDLKRVKKLLNSEEQLSKDERTFLIGLLNDKKGFRVDRNFWSWIKSW